MSEKRGRETHEHRSVATPMAWREAGVEQLDAPADRRHEHGASAPAVAARPRAGPASRITAAAAITATSETVPRAIEGSVFGGCQCALVSSARR